MTQALQVRQALGRYASPQERLTDPNAMQGIMRKCYGAQHFCRGRTICCYDTNELNKETTTEKISVVQQEMYKVLNINKKGINAERGPGADAFCCCVSLGGRRG